MRYTFRAILSAGTQGSIPANIKKQTWPKITAGESNRREVRSRNGPIFERWCLEVLLWWGAPAQEVAAALLTGPLQGRIVRTASFVSIGLLPKDVRAAYGLPWNEARQKQLLKLAAMCRRLRPWLPDLLCVNPIAWLADICAAPKRVAVN